MSQPKKQTPHTVSASCVGAGDTPQPAAMPTGDTPFHRSSGAEWAPRWLPSTAVAPLSLEAVEDSETQEEDEPNRDVGEEPEASLGRSLLPAEA